MVETSRKNRKNQICSVIFNKYSQKSGILIWQEKKIFEKNILMWKIYELKWKCMNLNKIILCTWRGKQRTSFRIWKVIVIPTLFFSYTLFSTSSVPAPPVPVPEYIYLFTSKNFSLLIERMMALASASR